MNHAKTSLSTEIFAGAIISVVQYSGPLRYVRHNCGAVVLQFWHHPGQNMLVRNCQENSQYSAFVWYIAVGPCSFVGVLQTGALTSEGTTVHMDMAAQL
jgi:hypothetical protein